MSNDNVHSGDPHQTVRSTDQWALVEGINTIFREALAAGSEDQLMRVCLKVTEGLTGSSASFIGSFDAYTGRFEIAVTSSEARIGPREKALAQSVFEASRSVIMNVPEGDFAAAPSLLGVALIERGKTIGMMGLANGHGGFSQIHQDQAEALAGAIQYALRSKRSELACRASEERLTTLTQGIAQLVWRAGHPREWSWSGPQWSAFTGQSLDQSLGRGWLKAVHPDDRKAVLAAWRDAGDTGVYEVEHRIRSNENARYRWFQSRGMPIRDHEGCIVEWLGTSTDIDDLKRLQEHERVLVAELQHRVRNTLSIIRSIVRRSIVSSRDLEQLETHLEGRIGAFARAQTALSRSGAALGLQLQELIESELDTFRVREGKVTTIEGPDVALKPKPAEILSLAIHELATNAVKYGALAQDDGHITVTWKLSRAEIGDCLILSWCESHPDRPTRPGTPGFGTELLTHWLPYELDAKASMLLSPHGMRFELCMPSADIILE